ncbi:MAG TPA: PSD1 and planctomycete cytochrome C domain-containing protein [Verrucomicrobiae bacterium]|nr:PSD1 and planctomycete cytochrome C domain-containing protein [Verrucomicrobiae bacterium]
MMLGAAAFGAQPAIDVSRLPAPAARTIDFVKDVQPILSGSCYNCHGLKRAEAGLRFDRRSDALRGSDNGPVIVAGKGSESVMVHAVSGLRDDLKMPKKGDPLTPEQVGILRAWIDQGAAWPDAASGERKVAHWGFKAPERPSVPAVKNQSRVRSPIDNFILARLEKENLSLAPEADKGTLLRRLNLDLIGLPPAIGDLNTFLNDTSEDAWRTQVERLLDSPHYGERWGRHWLDAARYADSDGFEKDKPRYIWFYRDYVINAFNRDLPYNQFIIEQLAGDLLPNPTQDQIVATGFLRNSMINEEGGVDPEQFRMDAMFDRMDAIGKSMLGLTIQCAQCHNHKYDPLTQEEYYRLFAFINNDHESSLTAYTVEEQRVIATLKRQMSELEADLKKRAPDWQDRMAKWEDSVKNDQPEWIVCDQLEHIGENDQRYYYYKDGSMLAAGYAPTKFSTVWKTTNKLERIGAFQLELFTDQNLPAGGPGRSFMGTCALTEFKVEAADAANPKNKMSVKIAKATADYANPKRDLEPNFYDKSTNNRVTGPIEFAIDDDSNTAWGIDAGPGRRNQDRKAVFVPKEPVAYSSGAILTFRLVQNHGGWNSDDLMNNNLGRFRLSVTSATNVTSDPLPKKVRDIITNVPRAKRTPAQMAAVFAYWRTVVPDWKDANDRMEKLWAQWPTGDTTLTLAARDEPRTTAILRRGDWLKPTKPVKPGVPSFLPALPAGADDSRLTLAKWIADRKSPTTARVFVNRMWQAYFGNGIVATPEDFGTQAESPSHPELLDWLACEFMDSGWSVKHMHRLIVNSATYRQSSKVTPELYAKDQYNRLLARGPRFRVEGEVVRDIALAASGLLNPKLGGRSVMPPAPAFVFQPPASYAPFPWIEETGPEKYRRAVYTWRRRSTPYPALQVFDVPNSDFSCVRRARSDTPLQALTTLNETLFMESAQALARRVIEQAGKSDRERIDYAFQLCVARKPSADEQQEFLAFLDKQRTRFAEGWLEPQKIADKVPPGATPTQVAAWTAAARVLLNLDETITKE